MTQTSQSIFLDDPGYVPAPEWTKDLVIYEIAPYGFTSPNGVGDGNGSGTFRSLREKLAYLEDLGITGIWLAGHCPCTNHFYNIKSVYACIRPDALDPALGDAADFKAMIDEAHQRGIRVFLDVITHGVVNSSPLISEHPNWFKPGTWGMTDYDYSNADFRAWWVNVWTRWVLDFGIDGYRLDVPRHDQMPLWTEVAQRCADAGHPIVLFPEIATTYHFSQRDYSGFSTDMAGEFSREPQFVGQQISCHDEGWEQPAGQHYRSRGNRGLFAYNLYGTNIPVIMAGEEWFAKQVSLPNLQRYLYGGGGLGGWMYGSQLQWDQLNQEPHRQMHHDVRKMLNIRKANRDLLHADRAATHIIRVPFSPPGRPLPYARFIPGIKAIVVVANGSHDMHETQVFTLGIPLKEMELAGQCRYRVTNLWTDAVCELDEAALSRYAIEVPSLYVDGGSRAIKIEGINPNVA